MVDRKYQLGTGGYGRFDFSRIEAVDRNAQAFLFQSVHCIGNATPAPFGFATDVDDIGAFPCQLFRLLCQFGWRVTRSMVDLRDDFNVVAIIGRWFALAEEAGQAVKVGRADEDGDWADSFERFERTSAVTGQKELGGLRGEVEVASDPAGSHQRGDGDGKDLDGIAKAERLGDAFHGALKRMRGQSSGDEVDVLTAKGIVTLHGNPSLSPLTPLSRVIAESSVDVDHLAVEKVGIGGGEEADDLGDIVGGSPPPCERLLGGSPVPLVRSRATPVGLNPAWRDAVDAHARSQRLGETSREGGHSGFDGGEHLSRVSFHPLVGLVPS